ncbi:hypothetical protein LOTGIDRAFT_239379 [Lottia gigantea]|uniref:Uncharacterized protein n=1 Tax=Lottia gigantea TaxID=225164 RepID=V3ZWR3_LOTGI|nr:hypothetical protein LOTGIDRAFT_239379 [Lottia gigantea]ESO95953.1 hypothetical protein LOTGIDRAFT_239379 [Lottia gigantea]
MEGQVFNPKRTVLIEEDLLDHVYDPPLWSGGPYLKMVDEEINFCYSPVSDPLLRTRLSIDDTGSESLKEFNQVQECRINLSNAYPHTTLPSHNNRLSRKTMYLISTCLAISGLLFLFSFCL